MNLRTLWVLMALSLAMVGSCSNDEDKSPDPDTPYPYATPSSATMQMNISDLEQGTSLAPVGLCHALAALAVTWINANVVVRLAVPSAALDACLHQVPVYLGDDTWRWTATGGVGASAWTAELTGMVRSANEIDWAMRVSGTVHALDRFLWFDGTSDAAARTGFWSFYDPAVNDPPGKVVTCAWSLPLQASEDRELEFENVAAGSPEEGDIVRYELADSIADVSLYDASAPATSRAHWDLRDGVGMAVSAAGDTCCWGARSAAYPDVACP